MFPTILATHHGDRVVLTICGELDLGTRQLLEERCAEVSTGDADLVLDLTGVSFVDCGSLRVLGHLLRSHGGRTHVLCPEGPVRRVLDLTGFSDLHDVRVGPTRRSGGAARRRRTAAPDGSPASSRAPAQPSVRRAAP